MIRLIPSSIAAVVLAALSTAGIAGEPSEDASLDVSSESKFGSIPDKVRSAAIDTLDIPSGEIAGAKIGSSDTHVVFVRSRELCGSGGCRAQIWANTDSAPIKMTSLPVGFLPIVRLPESDRGMPRLGVTVYPSIESEGAILPVAFEGTDYALSDWDNLLPRDAGEPIITSEMLAQF